MDIVSSIHNQVESLWLAAETWPDYVEAMQRALAAPFAVEQGKAGRQLWLHLPGLCCQAAGGDPRWAEPVAAAWELLRRAAHLLDSVEDGDLSDAWWVPLGPGPAMNVATGLFTSSVFVLDVLRYQGFAETVIRDVREIFYHGLLQACSGQHRDLTQNEPSLEECWQVAEAKSGKVFAAACRAGVRLVTDNPECLKLYGRFGHHLGLLIQIGDDGSGIWPAQGDSSDLKSGNRWTLPIAYAMTVSSFRVRTQLSKCLQAASQDAAAEAEARRLIEDAGAALYLSVEAERHREQARLALEEANSPSAVRDELTSMLDSVVPLTMV